MQAGDSWQDLARSWDDAFQAGQWDYLASLDEAPRFGIVAGYVHRLAPANAKVLDAGCGQGTLINHLDLAKLQYFGFDPSATAVEQARQRDDRARLSVSTLEAFAGESGPYDLIVFSEVLSVVPDSMPLLRKFTAFLAPGGHVIISQFQGKGEAPNARAATARLEAELASGWATIVATAEASNRGTGLAWRIYCVRLAEAPQP
jgi:2-polyprenyl-3-methyl-5-hydroxy-6-metoxy-1,4-benzoquinol methylase